MTLSVQRDLGALRSGVEKFLGRRVGEITRPAPGWSCETIIVGDDLVIRLPPVGEGIFPEYDLAQQAAVQQAVSDAGVPVPAPVTYVADPSFLGAPFITMPFICGVTVEEYLPADRWLRSLPGDHARHGVWRSFLDITVAIHEVDGAGLALRAGLDIELDYWTRYLAWATDGAPPTRLGEALQWCREHRPPEVDDCGLLWGDVRMGNVIFDADGGGPRAVLDWDMVTAGPIEMDLAWYLALDRVQIELTGQAVGGFGSHDDAVSLIEKRLGRELAELDWYEIFALVRATAVSTRIAILFERSGQSTMFRPGEVPTLDAACNRIAGRSG